MKQKGYISEFINGGRIVSHGKGENLDRENSAAQFLASPKSGILTVNAAGAYTYKWTRGTGVLVVSYQA